MADKTLFDSVKGPKDCERRNVFSGLDNPVVRFVPEKEVVVDA